MVLFSGADAAAKEPSILPYSGHTDDDWSREHSEEACSRSGQEGGEQWRDTGAGG